LQVQRFKTEFAETIFRNKYAQGPNDSWDALADRLVDDVCGTRQGTMAVLMSDGDRKELAEHIKNMRFLPGGRYLYYAGRPLHAWNNCYLLRAEEDTREEWSAVTWRAMSCLMTGGGIGIDYSRIRPAGRTLSRTGGVASGPIPLMYAINEIGRNVMQGGSRRSAIYASLNWQHEDIPLFLRAKNWDEDTRKRKEVDFNSWAPLDMTNISVNYDDAALYGQGVLQKLDECPVFFENCLQAMRTGEPGFSFNFGDKQNETLRNACTEVTTEDDSDVCNLGSINLSRIENITELRRVTELATLFLLCGTLEADLPYEKIRRVREQNRRLGLGLMGVHEWLMQRNYRYEVVPELHQWLSIYKGVSEEISKKWADKLGISRPVANRSIAPTGTIGIIAGTTTGIEPVYAVAYKRRYLKGTKWHYQYAVDAAAQQLIDVLGIDPDKMESSIDLANDYERRIKFQADVQDYVDMAISSTINLPPRENQTFTTNEFANVLAKYASRLRGFTCYPDGSRGGQPLTSVPYNEAREKIGKEFEEPQEWLDACSITGGGYCGM